MKKKYLNNHPWLSLTWFLLGIFCLLAILVGWRYSVKPNMAQKETIINKSLNEAVAIFNANQQQLLKKTKKIANELPLNPQASPIELYEALKEYNDLWGAVLVKDGKAITWTGYSLGVLKEEYKTNSLKSFIDIKKQNNVLFWLAHAGLAKKAGNDSTAYHLYTFKRITQNNILKIDNKREYHLLKKAKRSYKYPIKLSIFEAPPQNKVDYRVLRSASQDSVGIIYAVPSHFQQVLTKWKIGNDNWYSLFAVFFFATFLLFITIWLKLKSIWQNLFIRLLFISFGWYFFNHMPVSWRWLTSLFGSFPNELFSSYKVLFSFGINAIFLFLLAYVLHYTFRRSTQHYRKLGKTSSVIASFFVGAVAVIAILFVFNRAFNIVQSVSFSLLTLQITPSPGVILLYLSLGLALWAVTILLVNLNRIVFQLCYGHMKKALAASFIGFIIIGIIFNFFRNGVALNWLLYTGLIFYVLIGSLSLLFFRYPIAIKQSSLLRNVAIACFIVAIAGFPIIYFGQLENQDEMLAQTAKTYSQQKDPQAKTLVTNLLKKLHHQFKPLKADSLNSKKPMIESALRTTISTNIRGQSSLYKLHFQLITDEGKRIATYSNALSTPEWADYFNPSQFYATILLQGISKNHAVPVVQQPELVNQENYKTLYRGWIPLYTPSKGRPFAWIIGSVYQTRLDYKKPMQAVMASRSFGKWTNPLIIQSYKNGQLLNTIYKGDKGYFPIYNQLPVKNKLTQNDSLFYYNSTSKRYYFRNLIIDKPNSQVLKVSVVAPDLHNILFSFFRLYFTLVLFSLVVLVCLQAIREGKLELISKDTKFQYRILDSFLLATLAFLVLIITGTYFMLNHQNRNLVKQDLFNDLEYVMVNTDSVSNLQEGHALTTSIFERSEGLNTDLSFYINQTVHNSTTLQIYRQHLLPAVLPFPVYYQLYKKQKRRAIHTVNLSGQQLFMGYGLLFSKDNKPVAAVAVPAFVKSPVYRRRLLETASILVLLYVLVFSIFIGGAIFISHQLTKPLYKIREGLRQISKGDLDTTIPVESKDEIGILAASYNRMTKRLKKLQKELAKSEREAAWKEIAREAAHEIKNPLTPMKLNIQHLRHQVNSGNLSDSDLREKISQVTENLLVQIDALNTIAFNFLSYSSSNETEFKEVNVEKLVKHIIELHQNMEHASLKTNLNQTAVWVSGIEDDLHSAIFNLVKNAYEASPEKDPISITTYTKTSNYFIEVHNKGEVIPKEIRDDIFTPDFSTKPDGSGLGLAISKKVVTKHNGKISFTSTEEKGTTFTIKLPVIHPD